MTNNNLENNARFQTTSLLSSDERELLVEMTDSGVPLPVVLAQVGADHPNRTATEHLERANKLITNLLESGLVSICRLTHDKTENYSHDVSDETSLRLEDALEHIASTTNWLTCYKDENQSIAYELVPTPKGELVLDQIFAERRATPQRPYIPTIKICLMMALSILGIFVGHALAPEIPLHPFLPPPGFAGHVQSVLFINYVSMGFFASLLPMCVFWHRPNPYRLLALPLTSGILFASLDIVRSGTLPDFAFSSIIGFLIGVFSAFGIERFTAMVKNQSSEP